MDDGLNSLWIKLFLFSKTSKPWSTLPSDYSYSLSLANQPSSKIPFIMGALATGPMR
jgi:hypothetical protein